MCLPWRRRLYRRLYAWTFVTLSLTSAGGSSPVAAATADVSAANLATVFVTALNNKDGRLLGSLYADAPSLLCTDLDILVANQLSGHEEGDLVLSRLVKSQATITPPGTARAPGGRTVVVFSATWTYRVAGDSEDRVLPAEVTWTIRQEANAIKIVDQQTKPLDPNIFGC